MIQKQIEEGNELIAEFMENPENGEGYGQEEKDYYAILFLRYHSSWDWLMPCIGKISNQCEEPEELDSLKYALLTNNIEEAYSFVVDYLKDRK